MASGIIGTLPTEIKDPELKGRLVRNDSYVDGLFDAIRDGKNGLSNVPAFLKIVIEKDMWRDRLVSCTRERVQYSSFEAFVTDDVPNGLKANMKMLRGLCNGDAEAIDALDRVTQGKPGAPEGNQNAVKEKTNGNIVTNCLRPEGNTSAKAVRRLRKERPDLHAKVMAGELSPHAAMVEAGFRPRTVSVRVDVAGFVNAIKRELSESEARMLAEMILNGGER